MSVTLIDLRFRSDGPPFCNCGRNKPRWEVRGAFTLWACIQCLGVVADILA